MDFNIGDRVQFTPDTIRQIDNNSLNGPGFTNYRDDIGIIKHNRNLVFDIIWESDNHYAQGYYTYRFEKYEKSDIDDAFQQLIEDII